MVSKLPAWPLHVESHSYCTITRAADPDENYDRDDTDMGGTAEGLKMCTDQEASLVVPFEPVEGETLYLVWCTRSTGDSFGQDSGIFEALCAFRTPWRAQNACAMIHAHAKLAAHDRMDTPYSVSFYNETGLPELCSTDWIGYFESLESIQVSSFTVGSTDAFKRQQKRNQKAPLLDPVRDALPLKRKAQP